MGNLTVVSTIFWLCIVGNLSDVSIHLSNEKSNRCYINFFCLVLQAIYPLFQYLSQMGHRTVDSTIFLTFIIGNLSVVSYSFLKYEIETLFQQFRILPL